jgi:hypothetical protein
MQKWEYLFVVLADGTIKYMNGKEYKGPAISIADFMADAGNKGWELVMGQVSYPFTLILKRPLE